jgi:hypothetical protein
MINTAGFIDELPRNIRQQVLFSVVGSINSSLIGTAQTVLRTLERTTGLDDIKEVSAFEVREMLRGPDLIDTTLDARHLNALAQHWRDDLQNLTDQPEAGELGSTIDFMIKSPRKVDENMLVAILEAAGLKDVPVGIIAAKYDAQQEARSSMLAKQRGEIEWLIEQGFSSDDIDAGSPLFESHTVFDNLSETVQERLTEKLQAALQRTRDSAVIGVLNRDKRWTLGDLPVIASYIKELEAA